MEDEEVKSNMESAVRRESLVKGRKAFKAKMMAISRMTKMLRTLQKEKEAVLAIKNTTHDGRLPRGLL